MVVVPVTGLSWTILPSIGGLGRRQFTALQIGGGWLQVPSCKQRLSLAPCMTYPSSHVKLSTLLKGASVLPIATGCSGLGIGHILGEHVRSDCVHSPVGVQVILRGLIVEGKYPCSHVRVTSSPISYTRFRVNSSIPAVIGGRPHTFLDVAVAYKATWLRSSKVNVGAILLGVKSPQCPIHTEPTLGLLANGPLRA